MVLVAIAWLYVVVLMALVEGTSDHGTWLGAFFTLFLYGLLPLGIVLYLLGTPARRARRLRDDPATTDRGSSPSAPGLDPDRSGHPAGDAVAPIGKEP